MKRSTLWNLHRALVSARWGFVMGMLACVPASLFAQGVVPGTGERMTKAGDDFEDEKWAYTFNLPKSSEENDKQQRLPAGGSKNGRWFEGVMRGQPDVIERVPTPEGGIPGSEGSLLLRSKQTGVPGHYSGQQQQDDLIVNCIARLGGPISVSRSPSVVVRVFVPPFDQWEQRTGSSFGFRTACMAYKTSQSRRRGGPSLETYWPGMFIQLDKPDPKTKQTSGMLVVRGGPQGHDFLGKRITEVGWWTLGMSFTPDGQVHYYAHPGVEDLTARDHISSQFPYGFKCERLDTFFFNVVSGDNGTWSTPWIIDDPALYCARR